MDNYQYSLTEKLSFVRCGGTEEELRAANILLQEIREAGGEGTLMEFQIPAFTLEKCAMRVTAPFEREIPVIPYGRAGSLPEGGKDFKICYAEKGREEDFFGMEDLSDTAVIVNELNLEVYRRLCEKKAGAFLVIVGKYYEDLTTCSAYSRILRDKFLEYGKLPGYMIAAPDATDLIRDEAERVHLEMRQTDQETTSRNVLAVIPGTEAPKESIVLTAHYDSVPVGTGSWDNATGAATLMYIYRYFLTHPPRRTMRFLWCGSEELGLLGSRAYVEQNEALIPEIKFCFNFDMCGTVLGPNLIFVTGTPELETFARQFCRHEGYAAEFKAVVHSSDSAPFADKGVPSIGLSRGTPTASIHTRHDLMFPLSARQLKINGDFAIKMISHVAESVILPVSTGMPEDVKKELDKYFQRNVDEKKDSQ